MQKSPRETILLVNFSSRGGLAHHIYFLCDALAQQKADFVLLTTRDFELADLCANFRCKMRLFSHIRYRWMPLKALVYCVSLLLVFFEMRKLRPAILHLQEMRIPLFENWLFKAAHKRDVRVVFTVHDLVNTDVEQVGKRSQLAKTYHSFDHVIVHTEANKQLLQRDFDVPPARMTVLPVGEYTALPGNPLDQQVARIQLGIPTSRKVALFFGYIRKYKGLNLLLEAFRQVSATLQDAFLIIAGEPKDDLAAYETFIAEHDLAASVLIDARYVPLAKMSEYFAAADVVVLPYRRVYQSGLVRLAYAHRRPVIATRVGDLPMVVEHGRSGYLVAPDSAEALQQALLLAFSQMAKLHEMGEYGFARMREKFSWQSIAEQHRKIYQELFTQAT